MNCEWFGECGSCTLPLEYNDQLAIKKRDFLAQFEPFGVKDIEVFTSAKSHYRNRGEFRVWHEESGGLTLAMFKKNGLVAVSHCPAMHKRFNEMIGGVLAFLDERSISRSLFEIDFLSSTDGADFILILIYHRAIDDEWVNLAQQLADRYHISVIGRSKKQKIVIGNEYINETVFVGGDRYSFIQSFASFTQPNGGVNAQMIGWVTNMAAKSRGDFLELYCGNGNFTIPVSKQSDRVVAIEQNKNAIVIAKTNAENNHSKNISFVRMNANEFSDALRKVREFNRLKEIDLDSYHFKTALVDPPRAGLDLGSLEIISQIDSIIYISCNPISLAENLQTLTQTHYITHAAIFDQFPYTHHIECGVYLERNK
ncbi:tRNA/tmRNA (uracil-C(5))-methyltransferase [Campylobacterota bacterium]|nr:tRNA/tmRNA (uracil-C(5))-methyltransferase [Campylobacterota bacterium]